MPQAVRTGRRPLAVVTGSGAPDGIGFACARLFGRAGMRLLLTATSPRVVERADELRHDGADVATLVGDLTCDDDVAALGALAAELGGAQVLVNNAGMTSQSAGTDRLARADLLDRCDFEASLARNLTTAFLVTRAVLPGMRRSRYGRIVLVSSVTGPVAAFPGTSGYAAAKAGMVGLVRTLAVENADRGITVNAVAPGWIATGSSTRGERAAGAASPAGRPGTPAEVAAAVAFFASETASYVTGQVLVVDGGNTVAEDHRPLRRSRT